MKKSLDMVFALLLTASCQGEALQKVKILETTPPGPAVVIFYLRSEIPEPELRAKMDAAGRELFPAHPYVEVYAFRDQDAARGFASEETMKKILETGVTPGALALSHPSRKFPGGAFLALSHENQEGVWVMSGRPEK